ncbi:LysR family transcriptional regulator [Tsukamurella soli]|uniref:LysR family transcriptional regulator n=1 Tax=Tsukamurella soli TaxID=644556 RepID=A0ABP8J798_9ACTN
MIDTHRLMIFRSVVASGSVNGAAAVLGYTPSAVSQHVAALQRETGLKLLERVGRGIEPTPAGRVLAAEAAKVMAQIDALGATVDDLRAGTAGRLTISGFSSAGTHWMPDVIAELTTEFPQTRVLLRIEEETTDIERDRPDIALVVRLHGGPRPGAGTGTLVRIGHAVPSGYTEHAVVTEPYVAVLPAGHELAVDADGGARAWVDLAELAPYRWVDNDVRQGPCRQSVLDACAAAGFTPKFVVETTDYPAALRFVARGIGLTVLPRLGATELPAGTVALPVRNPTPERAICALVKDSESQNPVVIRALALIRAFAVAGSVDGTAESA